jgi:hypothetical protein
MTVFELIKKIKQAKSLNFLEVLNTIDSSFNFTPTKFTNGAIINEANSNNGSCKVFSFAKMKELTCAETLFLFGEHYQKVVETENDEDHQNIRNFIKSGWEGIHFEKDALLERI